MVINNVQSSESGGNTTIKYEGEFEDDRKFGNYQILEEIQNGTAIRTLKGGKMNEEEEIEGDLCEYVSLVDQIKYEGPF